jgi:hypothetical protein
MNILPSKQSPLYIPIIQTINRSHADDRVTELGLNRGCYSLSYSVQQMIGSVMHSAVAHQDCLGDRLDA